MAYAPSGVMGLKYVLIKCRKKPLERTVFFFEGSEKHVAIRCHLGSFFMHPYNLCPNRSCARLHHMLKIHHQASFVRHLLKFSLPSWCFHVGILFILTAVGIGSR